MPESDWSWTLESDPREIEKALAKIEYRLQLLKETLVLCGYSNEQASGLTRACLLAMCDAVLYLKPFVLQTETVQRWVNEQRARCY